MQSKKNTSEKSELLPPGRFGLPLIGETLSLAINAKHFIQKRIDAFGPVFKTNIFGQKTVFITRPDGIKWVFSGENKYLESSWPKPVRKILGEDSIFNVNGSEHRKRRRMLKPYFLKKNLHSYFEVISKYVDECLQSYGSKVKGEMNVTILMHEITLKLIIGLIFEDEDYHTRKFEKEFKAIIKGFLPIFPINLPFIPYGRALKAGKTIRKKVLETIRARRKSGDLGNDLLSILLKSTDEEGEELNETAILDDVISLLFAGHLTVSTTMTNMLFLLALHPDIQQKCFEEVSDREINENSIMGFTYLLKTINETLRYLPPAAGFFRKVTQDVEYNGFTFPKGLSIVCSILGSHYAPESFPEPERFNPERFSTPKDIPPCSHIPFAGGDRLCIGQHLAYLELLIISSKLIQTFEFEISKGQNTKIAYVPFVTLKDNLKLTFKKRRE